MWKNLVNTRIRTQVSRSMKSWFRIPSSNPTTNNFLTFSNLFSGRFWFDYWLKNDSYQIGSQEPNFFLCYTYQKPSIPEYNKKTRVCCCGWSSDTELMEETYSLYGVKPPGRPPPGPPRSPFPSGVPPHPPGQPCDVTRYLINLITTIYTSKKCPSARGAFFQFVFLCFYLSFFCHAPVDVLCQPTFFVFFHIFWVSHNHSTLFTLLIKYFLEKKQKIAPTWETL